MAIKQVKNLNDAAADRQRALTIVAKALWFSDVGADRPNDPVDVQAAYNPVKTEYLERAYRLEKLLDNLGYVISSKR